MTVDMPDEPLRAPTAFQKRIGWMLIAAGMIGLLYMRWHPVRLGPVSRGCAELFFGAAVLILTRHDIRSGITSMRGINFARAEKPRAYWFSIASGLIAGLGLVAFALHDLMSR